MKKLLSFVLLMLVTPILFAGPFDPPPGDQSRILLGVIFGSNIGDIPLGGSPNPVLSEIMEKFNFIVVVVGLVVVSYVSILSIINTANEGTAMGKKWSAVWIPMRSVAGMALMVPAPASGYSMIQVTVMWIILQGIGAADALWNIALDGLLSGSSASAGTVITTANTNLDKEAKDLSLALLDAQTCMDTLYKQSSSDQNISANNGEGSWLAKNGQLLKNFAEVTKDEETEINITMKDSQGVDKNFTTYKYTVEGVSYFGVNNPNDNSGKNICGSIKILATVNGNEKKSPPYPTQDEVRNAAYKVYYTKLNTISSMLTALQPLANGLANGLYVQPLNTDEYYDSNNPPPRGYIQNSIDIYKSSISSLVNPWNLTTSLDEYQKEDIRNGKNNGWISAGAYYFIFNKSLTATLFDSATNPAQKMVGSGIPVCPDSGRESEVIQCKNGFQNSSITNNLLNSGITFNEDIKALSYNLAMAYTYYSYSADANQYKAIFSTTSSDKKGASETAAKALNAATSYNAKAIEDLSNLLNTKEGDPLMNISKFGQSLMLGIEGSFLAVISLAILTALGSLFPNTFTIMGTSIPVADIGKYMAVMTIIILGMYALLLPVFALLWGFGAMLAVYCPLIPFMIFTMAALGWMLTVVEAIIAAPIVALGIIMPSGDELGKLEPALNILANIFLRPMLMIFGFLLAGRVYKAIILLINFGMGSVFNSIDVSTMLSTLVVIAVYATFIMSITNTCFSLIYAVPDKILRWIGGGHEQTDVGAVSEAKGAAQSAGQEIGGGMKEGGKAMGKMGMKNSLDSANKSSSFKALSQKLGIEDSVKGKDKKE